MADIIKELNKSVICTPNLHKIILKEIIDSIKQAKNYDDCYTKAIGLIKKVAKDEKSIIIEYNDDRKKFVFVNSKIKKYLTLTLIFNHKKDELYIDIETDIKGSIYPRGPI